MQTAHASLDDSPPADRSAGLSALLGQVIAQSPVGIAVIDHDGICVDANPAYARLFGYTRDELLGQPFTMVHPPAQHDRIRAAHRAFLDHGAEMAGEFDMLRRDGRTMSIRAESTRLPGLPGSPGSPGRPRRLVCIAGVTQRRQAELAANAPGRILNSVVDALASHVCVLDEAGTIVAVNQAWRDFAAANGGAAACVLEGASYVGVCQRSLASTPPAGEEAQAFAPMLDEVLAGRRTHFQLEYPCHSADEQRWFVARVARMAGSDPARFVVTHDNVTPLKQAQETLRRREALMLDLAASIPGALFRLVHRADGRWRFNYFSPGILALFGLTPEQACSDIRALGERILPEDKAEHDESLRRAIVEQVPWAHEYRIRTPDGVLKWVHVLATPKTVESGKRDEPAWTGVLTDVSARKQIEAVLRASEEKYRALFETVPQGVVYHDAQGRITSANPAAQRILGLTLGQMQGLDPIDPRWQTLREDGSDFPGDQRPAMVALRSGLPVTDVMMGVAVPDRGHAWLLVNATPLFREGELQQVYATFEDITDRVRLSRELQQQASTDFLTGLANRRSLMDRLQLEFDRTRRHPEVRCSVLSVDLDHFKQINDTWGHAAGDAVLQHVAQLMQQTIRHNDLVARSGGEEFILLLPDTGADEAQVLGERLRERIVQLPTELDGRRVLLSASVGISVIGPADANLDAVLARADQALYAAKQASRNTVRLALP